MNLTDNKIPEARVIQVIYSKVLIGTGIDGDPYRRLIIIFDFDGNILATRDELKEHVENRQLKASK